MTSASAASSVKLLAVPPLGTRLVAGLPLSQTAPDIHTGAPPLAVAAQTTPAASESSCNSIPLFPQPQQSHAPQQQESQQSQSQPLQPSPTPQPHTVPQVRQLPQPPQPQQAHQRSKTPPMFLHIVSGSRSQSPMRTQRAMPSGKRYWRQSSSRMPSTVAFAPGLTGTTTSVSRHTRTSSPAGIHHHVLTPPMPNVLLTTQMAAHDPGAHSLGPTWKRKDAPSTLDGSGSAIAGDRALGAKEPATAAYVEDRIGELEARVDAKLARTTAMAEHVASCHGELSKEFREDAIQRAEVVLQIKSTWDESFEKLRDSARELVASVEKRFEAEIKRQDSALKDMQACCVLPHMPAPVAEVRLTKGADGSGALAPEMASALRALDERIAGHVSLALHKTVSAGLDTVTSTLERLERQFECLGQHGASDGSTGGPTPAAVHSVSKSSAQRAAAVAIQGTPQQPVVEGAKSLRDVEEVLGREAEFAGDPCPLRIMHELLAAARRAVCSPRDFDKVARAESRVASVLPAATSSAGHGAACIASEADQVRSACSLASQDNAMRAEPHRADTAPATGGRTKELATISEKSHCSFTIDLCGLAGVTDMEEPTPAGSPGSLAGPSIGKPIADRQAQEAAPAPAVDASFRGPSESPPAPMPQAEGACRLAAAATAAASMTIWDGRAGQPVSVFRQQLALRESAPGAANHDS